MTFRHLNKPSWRICQQYLGGKLSLTNLAFHSHPTNFLEMYLLKLFINITFNFYCEYILLMEGVKNIQRCKVTLCILIKNKGSLIRQTLHLIFESILVFFSSDDLKKWHCHYVCLSVRPFFLFRVFGVCSTFGIH